MAIGNDFEQILAESMRNSKQNEEYWAEKCGELERRSANLAAQLKHEKKAADDERMGWQFSRIELDRRLHSAIEHASILNTRWAARSVLSKFKKKKL